MSMHVNFATMLPLLALLPGLTAGHMMSLCSLTGGDGQAPGEIIYMLTSYHDVNEGGPGGSTPSGNVHIKYPDGHVQIDPFTNACTMNNHPGQTSPCSGVLVSNPTTRSGCQLPTGGDFVCYYQKDTNSAYETQTNGITKSYGYFAARSAPDICAAHGYQTSGFQSAYMSTVILTAGTYELWTEGTDYKLDPCGDAGQACRMSANFHVMISPSIMGTGGACTFPPTISGTNNQGNAFTATKVAGVCESAGETFDGSTCTAYTCPAGLFPNGAAICNDTDVQTDTFSCNPRACEDSDCPSADFTTFDLDTSDGCDCVPYPCIAAQDCPAGETTSDIDKSDGCTCRKPCTAEITKLDPEAVCESFDVFNGVTTLATVKVGCKLVLSTCDSYIEKAGEILVEAGAEFVLESGVVLENNGKISVFGKLILNGDIQNHNTLSISGTFINSGNFENKDSGSVSNKGTLSNQNNFYNEGVNSKGDNDGLPYGVVNEGTFVNELAGTLHNHGSIENEKAFLNHGTINNDKNPII